MAEQRLSRNDIGVPPPPLLAVGHRRSAVEVHWAASPRVREVYDKVDQVSHATWEVFCTRASGVLSLARDNDLMSQAALESQTSLLTKPSVTSLS